MVNQVAMESEMLIVDGLRNVQARLDLPRFSGARASLMVDYSLGHVDRESVWTGDDHSYGDPRYVKDGNVTACFYGGFQNQSCFL